MELKVTFSADVFRDQAVLLQSSSTVSNSEPAVCASTGSAVPDVETTCPHFLWVAHIARLRLKCGIAGCLT